MNRTRRLAAVLMAATSAWHHDVAAAENLRQQQNHAASLQESRRIEAVPAYNQEIRGGFEIEEALPWYLVFADTTICGGALVSSCGTQPHHE